MPPSLSFLQELPDSARADSGMATAYDTVWADSAQAVTPPPTEGLESVMLSQDKIYVVLAVVLIIWLGIVFFLYRTDRRIERLERDVQSGIVDPEDGPER